MSGEKGQSPILGFDRPMSLVFSTVHHAVVRTYQKQRDRNRVNELYS